jgi:hypothetical protein
MPRWWCRISLRSIRPTKSVPFLQEEKCAETHSRRARPCGFTKAALIPASPACAMIFRIAAHEGVLSRGISIVRDGGTADDGPLSGVADRPPPTRERTLGKRVARARRRARVSSEKSRGVDASTNLPEPGEDAPLPHVSVHRHACGASVALRARTSCRAARGWIRRLRSVRAVYAIAQNPDSVSTCLENSHDRDGSAC